MIYGFEGQLQTFPKSILNKKAASDFTETAFLFKMDKT